MVSSFPAARAQAIRWTRPYLTEITDEIRQALEVWAGEPGQQGPDLDQARAAAEWLADALEMLCVPGAARLARTLQRALEALKEPDAETATVLLEAVAILPDYLERLETGAPDVPEVLSQFIQRAQSAAGVAIEPDRDELAYLDPLVQPPETSQDLEVGALRRAYQHALRDWLKDAGQTAAVMAFCRRLQAASMMELRRLGVVAGAVFSGLAGKQLQSGPEVQSRLARIDSLLHRLSGEPAAAGLADEFEDLTSDLLGLLEVAESGCEEIDRIRAVRPSDSVDAEELERARSVLSGRNRDLFSAIAEAARGELNRAKDSLNQFLLGQEDDVGAIENQVDTLRSVSESLGMLGLEHLRQQVLNQAGQLGELTADPENPVLLNIGRELLLVESELEEAELFLGQAPHSALLEGEGDHLPKAEHRRVMRQLLSECLDDLGHAKHMLDQVHKGQSEQDAAEQAAGMLERVAGVLFMAGQRDAAEMLEAGASCIHREMCASDGEVPDAQRLQALAEALVVVEFYLDSLTRLDSRGPEYLSDARDRLTRMGYMEPLRPVAADQDAEAAEADLAEAQDESEPESLPTAEDVQDGEDAGGPGLEYTPVDFEEELQAADAAGPDQVDAEQAGEQWTGIDYEPVDFSQLEGEGKKPGAGEVSADDDGYPSVEPGAVDADAADDGDKVFEFESAGDESVTADDAKAPGTDSVLDTHDFDLTEIFLEEFDEELAALRERIPQWRERPDSQALLADIRRSFHTLKGSGRMAGAHRIGEFAWQFEQVLNQVIDGNFEAEAVTDITAKAIEALPSLRSELVGETPEKSAEEIEALLAEVGEVGRETELPELEGLDETLIRLMIREISDHLETLDHWIETSRDQGFAADADRDLIRAVHTIKGTLRLAPIGDEAETMQVVEEYFQELLDVDQPPARDAINLMEDLRLLLGKRLDRLRRQAVSSEHFDTAGLASFARALIAGLHGETTGSAAEDREMADDSSPGDPSGPEEVGPIGAQPPEGEFDEPLAQDETGEQDSVSGPDDESGMDRADEIQTEQESAETEPLDQTAESDQEAEPASSSEGEMDVEAESIGPEPLTREARPAEAVEADAEKAEDSEERQAASAELTVETEELNEPDVDELDQAGSEEAGSEEAQAEEVGAADAGVEPSEPEAALDDLAETDEQKEAAPADAKALESDAEALTGSDQEDVADQSRVDEAEAAPEPDWASGSELDDEFHPRRRDEDTRQAEAGIEAEARLSSGDGIEIDYGNLDVDLLQLFLEEGQELLERSDGLLQQWRQSPEDRQIVTALQRDIHTIKGSARMAGLNPVGEVAHVLEDLLERIAGGTAQATAESIDTLEAGCDHLHLMLDAVEARDALPRHRVAEQLEQEHLELAEQDEGLDGVLQTQMSEVEPSGRASTIRLDAAQVEDLLNFAGEVSIYRSRVEQELGTFRSNISEVGQTVARLREQLRKLEQETEAQILSRFEREHGAADSTFDPLELDRYSTIQQLSRALAESVNDLNSLTELMDDAGRQSETLLMQQARVNTELQEGLMQARMVAFSSLAPRLRRVVRNAARDAGCRAELRLVMEGEGELDRSILDRVTAPIEHILRNSVAHGIEKPDARRDAGKAETGVITIEIDREATELVIRLSDDGRGLDFERIAQRALEQELLTAEQARDAEQLSRVIFQTGFSTVEEVSELAGRGVGMDVVASEIRQIGGRVAVDTEPGAGTRFTLRIPLSLAVMQAIFVEAGERLFAIPLTAVRGVAKIRPEEWRRALDAEGIYHYAGEDYPLIELEPQLGFEPAEIGDDSLSLLMIAVGEQLAAMRVTEIHSHREIVLKPVGPQISSIQGVLGGTILGDGQVIVILDMAPLIERALAEELMPGRLDFLRDDATEEVKRTPLVMVVDDSITMRRVTGRILEHHGLEVVTARDGVEAVDLLYERVPDLMLLDIEMPRMDGFELATYVRDDARLAKLPIMMITSRSGQKHRQHAEKLGVNRYMIKPYQEANLVRNVFEMLDLPVPVEQE